MSNHTFQLYEKIDGKPLASMNVKIASVKSLKLIARTYINTDKHEQILVKAYLDGVECDDSMQPLSDYTFKSDVE